MIKQSILIVPIVLGGLLVSSTIAHADNNQGKRYIADIHSQLKIRKANDSLWSKPYGQAGANYLGGLDQFKDKDLTFTQLYVDANTGVNWLKFKENNTSYWVDASATSLANDNVTNVFTGKESVMFKYTFVENKYAIINPLMAKGNVYSLPDGEPGATKSGDLSQYTGKRLNIVKQAVNKDTQEKWFQIDNNTGKFWVKSSDKCFFF